MKTAFRRKVFIEVEEIIKCVEARDKQEVFEILESTGFERDCQIWREYSRAKKLFFDGLWLNSGKIYDRQIGWITEYLGL